MASPANASGRRGERLKSWKEIAAFFGTDVRTVRRWEQRGLPVRRVPGGARPTIYAEVAELEAWFDGAAAKPMPEGSGAAALAEAARIESLLRPRVARRAAILGGMAIAAGAAASLGYVAFVRQEALSPAAADLVDRGVEASRLGTADSTAEAVGLLEEAVRQAPHSARAWGALAIASFEEQHFLNDEKAAVALQRARAAAWRALDLDPRNAGGAAALALMAPTYRNWSRAEAGLRSALSLDPGQFEAKLALSRLLSNVGRIRDAIALVEPMARDQPLHPVLRYWLAFLLWQGGRIEESDALLDQGMRQWPRNYAIWFTRFWQLVYSGRAREALAMSEATSLRPIGIPEWNFELISLAARAVLSRAPAEVARALRAHEEAARRGVGFLENAIELSAYLGFADEAFRLAAIYYSDRGFPSGLSRYGSQQGSYTRPRLRETKMLFNPSTAAMRRDPRIASLLREAGLSDYWRASRTRPDLKLAEG